MSSIKFLQEFTPRGTMVLLGMFAGVSPLAIAAPLVPGYVAPVRQTPVPAYVDDTRGVYVPVHYQLRQKTEGEMAAWEAETGDEASMPLYAQKAPGKEPMQRALNTLANGVADTSAELDRIAQDPGLLSGGKQSADAARFASMEPASGGVQVAQSMRPTRTASDLSKYPSLATGGKAALPAAGASAGGGYASELTDLSATPTPKVLGGDNGEELAVGPSGAGQTVDLQHGVVRLKEERISVRRALQRMLDQVGGGSWTVVWDLDEVNAGLPDMEISIYAEEPFVKVLNALLARLQTRSGQPLRVVKYDKTQRLVITDRVNDNYNPTSAGVGGKPGGLDVAVTETVLKESKVSLHYDEIPLVDALENIVNQAGKGQWRLRMYAGTDHVLKPAHIEEPFGVAMERILKVVGLRYEIFPGGKLIVVTGSDRFGFRGIE